ncbi:hypothetical protein KJ693_07925 [bacterium]|nr:hypothetical protein [bacterium]
MPDINIFVSSRMEMQKERNLAKTIVENGLKFNAILYEHSAPESHARDWWRREIARANFFVYILGDYISWPIYDEFKIARSLGLHVLAFIKNEETIKHLISNSETITDRFDNEIYQHDTEGNHWFFSQFYGQEALKWEFYKSDEYFLNTLKEGIQSKLQVTQKHISVNEIYPENGIDEIEQIYVQPTIYEDALNQILDQRLIIIAGHGSIGKSTMGISILSEVRRRKHVATRDVIRPQATVESFERIEKRKNSLIFYDSPFGERDAYEPKDPGFASIFERIVELSKRNWIVITTRSKPLEIAKSYFEYRKSEKYIAELKIEHYGNPKLLEILRKHIDYRHNRGEISDSAYQIINSEDKFRFITRNLSFPHNIHHFVKDRLDNVTDEETLKIAVGDSKNTKEAARTYFLKLTKENRYFPLAVALFSDWFNNDQFRVVLKRIYAEFGITDTHLNVQRLRKETKYIRTWGNVAFEHQDYLDGALEAFRNKIYDEDIRGLKVYFVELSKDPNPTMRGSLWYAVNELARVSPEEAFPIVLDLMNDSSAPVRNLAFVPLKKFISNVDVGSGLGRRIELSELQQIDPNHYNILYRKAIRNDLIKPFIQTNDAKGLMAFTHEYNKYYKLYVFVAQALIEIYGQDKEAATTFFLEWYKEDPLNAIRSLQDRFWKGLTNSQVDFKQPTINNYKKFPEVRWLIQAVSTFSLSGEML